LISLSAACRSRIWQIMQEEVHTVQAV
jgi:hypothetical protein